ncbi:MAG: preprotein translocase subunit SecG [Candidatus Wildermuthbacteria bacterium RIFCSPHIGHO2_01_FULL_47_27]|uniref:Protein-export membrane protein SecG n=2 Tax=Candidatus Wildermuthiibacteriota TaxID=1817923 RepID=A0A1G2RT16_9BACT|nr:MAG: Preprotein translocase, SecG subunit [Parcubacteria group bacterium GW2011_GWA2_47_9]OHA63780.1 MAG: preprotein translocase subunit SecG [Candidatus Wildermuthbacteria bacterium RIFCSPHIGHO2_01_FULL_47_27]OHA68916.1 MAG: preprotein translocase subunit SecG [Candidatus Wildermuthbacteria bacterium RIFCSPHIGHO2_02_FULL_47_17]OHA75504.1 MAG: preprotein translocase subunit SecG [Candidatus Wildermuthbacteria bacterium RIFCSPLOWO2_02_FULL_47_10]OHA75519.1 MAG: preprotein translocase subunit 
MTQYLPIIQSIIAVLLIVLILLQQRGAGGLGGAFGGGGGFYGTMRGVQKKIFYATIILGTLFIFIAISHLIF